MNFVLQPRLEIPPNGSSLTVKRRRTRPASGMRGHRYLPEGFRLSGHQPSTAHGIDVDDDGSGAVTKHRLYQLIKQPKPIADRQLEIEFLDSGVEAFSFTFG